MGERACHVRVESTASRRTDGATRGDQVFARPRRMDPRSQFVHCFCAPVGARGLFVRVVDADHRRNPRGHASHRRLHARISRLLLGVAWLGSAARVAINQLLRLRIPSKLESGAQVQVASPRSRDDDVYSHTTGAKITFARRRLGDFAVYFAARTGR